MSDNASELLEPSPKKPRVESKENNGHDKSQDLKSFKDFTVDRVLNNSEQNCSLAVVGKFKEKKDDAVVVLQKVPFSKEKVSSIFSDKTSLQTLFANDIYNNQVAFIPPDLNEVRATIICPAEDKHIKRYEKMPSSFINETPELYATITEKFINSSSLGKQWIYNILEHKKEVERIVCEDLDPEIGFIMVPDLKWSGRQVEDLYLQVLVMRRDISSIRDLRGEHIPLLNNIYDKGTAEIKKRYGVPPSKMRVYFHYQPSFYHLHVHFSALTFDAPGTWAGKAHLLKDVVRNLEIDPDYYKKAVLSFTIKDSHPIKLSFEEMGYFKDT